MGILGSMLGKREPAAAYRTIDGGHPAPFPDMTDEQLYNYEMTFNVARKTFDTPPPAVIEAQRRAAAAAQDAQQKKHSADRATKPTFDAPRYTSRGAQTTEATGATEEWSEKTDWGDPGESRADMYGTTVTAVRKTRPEAGRPLDLTRPVRTITTKQPVDIITTRARHPVYKVHGYIGDDDVVTVFTLDGRLSENGPQFLENVPQQQQLHLNIYRNREPGAKEKYLVTQHETREDADAQALAGRITCVAVRFDL
ncbi:hypothetical protein GCM10027343_12970 [Noviherbaspirillum agri]